MTSDFGRSHRLERCRLCQSPDLDPYLDLGAQPPANRFIRPTDVATEKRFPLEVVRCVQCGFSQLSFVVAAQDLYSQYSYLSSTSAPLREHYAKLARALCSRFDVDANSLAVDVGANDGVMLKGFSQVGPKCIGIEPSDAGVVAMHSGFHIVRRFLDAEAVREVVQGAGRARIVTATNVFAHIDDLVQAADCFRGLLDEDGVLVVEAPYLHDMLEGLYFDTVYHEHLSYISAAPLIAFLKRQGLRLFDVERVDFGASGPALRLFICPDAAKHATGSKVRDILEFERKAGLHTAQPYLTFSRRIWAWREKMLATIAETRQGARLGAYTAPAKGNTLLNFLQLTPQDLVAVAENNERKIGMITPGTHIPIVSDETFSTLGIDYAILLSWNYAAHFVAKSEFKRGGGRFIIPLPQVRIA